MLTTAEEPMPGGQILAGVPGRKAQVEAELDRFTDVSVALLEVVATLADRLAPVLRSPTPERLTPAPVEDTLVLIAERVRDGRTRVQTAVDTLRDLLDRLEV